MSLLAWLLLGCSDYALRPPSAGSTMRACPSPVELAPLPPDALGSFDLSLRGNDNLVGVRWLPAPGSRLDVDVQGVGERFVGRDGDRFPLTYTLLDALPGEDADTGNARDDGLLRLFFRETPTVDVWVEVVRGEALDALRDRTENPCTFGGTP